MAAQTQNMGRTYTASQNVRYANEGATGTTLHKLAKLTGAPSTAIITATGDTAGIVGIVVAGAGNAGSADIAFAGKASCVFDSATTAGHYVVNDTSTAGDCMDAGATYPTTGQVIGVVTSTNGGAGTYEVDLTLKQPQAGGGGGTAATPYITVGGTTYGPVFTMTPPGAIGGWTWVNQGTATADGSNGSLTINAPADASDSSRILVKAAPATPYFVMVRVLTSTAQFPDNRAGVLFRESGTGKLIVFNKYIGSNVVSDKYMFVSTLDKYTNETTYSGSSYISFTPRSPDAQWQKMVDDGVNLKWYWCLDNLNPAHCTQYFSVSRTDFMAGGPNQVGFYANPISATRPVSITVLDWTTGVP
jgi:hypothetical protein